MTNGLPKNWEEWLLRDAGEWLGGGTPSSSNAAYWNGDIPWVSPKDMKVAVITSTQDKITTAAIHSSAVKLIPARSVLFVTRSGILSHSFPVATTRHTVTVNQDLKAIAPVEVINPEYLAWVLRARERQLLHSCSKHGTTVHSIEISALKSLKVPIAPPGEQRRIVAKLEELFSELDTGIQALIAAREQLKAYRQSLLKHAFEGKLTQDWRARNPYKVQTPTRRLATLTAEANARFAEALCAWEAKRQKGPKLPKPRRHEVIGHPQIPQQLADNCTNQWPWLRLGDVSKVTGGLTKNAKRSTLPVTMKYLRVANVYGDRLELDDVSEMGVTEDEYVNTRLQPGDMLVVEGNGSVEQIGRVAVWGGEIPNVGHQNHLIRVRFTFEMLPRFFLLFLMSPLGRDLIVRQASSTSGLHTLSISKVSGLPVPVPTAEEQALLLAALDGPMSEIKELAEEIEAGLARCSALRQSILEHAFSGQLVPQDTKDEPASMVLERIRRQRNGATPKKERTIKNGKKIAA